MKNPPKKTLKTNIIEISKSQNSRNSKSVKNLFSRPVRSSITLLIFIFLSFNHGFGQQPKSYLYENEIDFSLPLKNSWSVDFGIGNRGLLAETIDGETSGYQHEHVEINQFTNYSSGESLVFSLGLRYRLREIFDSSNTDEFRIIEQIEIGPFPGSIPLSHRFRLEQRFRENTIHRMRYRLQFGKPINENFSWSTGMETLYSVSTRLKPEAEQRFSLGLGNTFFKDLELEIGLEYRMENFARNLGHEFFIVTGIGIDL